MEKMGNKQQRRAHFLCAAEGIRRRADSGSPFFGSFLWASKETNANYFSFFPGKTAMRNQLFTCYDH